MAFELDQDTIYQAYDRFVCAEPDCAGITAGRTGRTIDGHRLLELTTRMVIEWYRFVPNVTLTCECGRLEAVLTDGQPIIRPAEVTLPATFEDRTHAGVYERAVAEEGR